MSFDIALSNGTLHVRTNNVPREIVYEYQLTAEERVEFDYLDWAAMEAGRDSRSFVRFKGELYDLNDTEGPFPHDRRWFYRSDSFFSGVLFRYADDDFDRIVVATYYS